MTKPQYGIIEVELPDPLHRQSFFPPEVMLKILLQVQTAGQVVPQKYFPTDGSEEFPFGEGPTRALKQLSNDISVAFVAKIYLSRTRSSYIAEAKRMSKYRELIRGLLGALDGPDGWLLQHSFWSPLRPDMDEQLWSDDTALRSKEFIDRLTDMEETTNRRLESLDEKIASREKQPSRGSGREIFFNRLEQVYRTYIAGDSNWQPTPRDNKRSGADPFSVFVSATAAARGHDISPASAARIMRSLLKNRSADSV